MIEMKLEDLIATNSDIFSKELKKVINPSFDGLDNPEKYESIVSNIVSQSSRDLLLRQSRLVAAATEYIENKNKALIISAEMGSGKTTIAVQISMSQKLAPVCFVVCPPHLVKTWLEELEINYKNPKAYKAVVVKRFEDLVPYAKRNLWNDGVKYYFIVARETLKLSYPKTVAVNVKRKYFTVEKQLDGEMLSFKQLSKVACCPDCNSILVEGNDNYVSLDKVPMKCTCGSVLRQPDRTVSDKLGTRESIADYVFKQFPKGSYNVILDEAHEYKGGSTGQGNAMARIVANSRKTIALTGTLMNGYASSLFYLLYRLNPYLMKTKLGFDYNQVANFVSTYGAHEEIVEAKEVTTEGVVTRMGKRIAVKEKAKISPFLLSVLLDMTIFLRLDEIKMPLNLQLPDYTEIIDLVPMEDELKAPYMRYISDITKEIRKDKRLLGNLATDAIAIPDMPFTPKSAQDKLFYEPETTREEFGITAKEQRLIDNVRKELDDGRNCMVYLTFTNQIVATDITTILSEAFPSKVIKFLPSSVQPTKRKEWIEKNPCDVLIANPELVKTGLTLLQFPTIIFYEVTYNVFTLKQASRRSWRIGQTQAVKVIFMAYENTPQHIALKLIGAKVGAANSLEGRLSGDDDLSSMADEEDNIQLALAKAILSGDSASGDIAMTSIKNFGANREFDNFELYYQRMLDARTDEVIEDSEIIDSCETDLFDDIADNVEYDRDMEMFETMAKELIQTHNDKTLYGKDSVTVDSKGKETVTTSFKPMAHCFEICDNYREGKFQGLSYHAVSEQGKMREPKGIEIYRVTCKNRVPFMPISNSQVFLPIETFQSFIKDSNENSKELANLLSGFVNTQKFKTLDNEEDEVSVFESLLDYDGEITSTKFFFYEGKGKNQKRIEVESTNLIDYIPEQRLASGIQLSLF